MGEIRKGANEAHKHVEHSTIFHELLHSDLPEEEKFDARLGDEAQLIVAAGLITTSWALTVGIFHLSNNPDMCRKLRAELAAAGSTSTKPLDWHKLEQLPFLSGCVHEAVRLSHGVTTRSPRLTQEVLKYGEWVIPPNTPVSMTSVDILMNDTIFPNPKSFIPERWISKPNLDRYFVPFSKGTRACPGIKYFTCSTDHFELSLTDYNLAQAELYFTLAVVFTRFDFQLYETDISDVEMAHAYLVPYPKWETKGVRVKVKAV